MAFFPSVNSHDAGGPILLLPAMDTCYNNNYDDAPIPRREVQYVSANLKSLVQLGEYEAGHMVTISQCDVHTNDMSATLPLKHIKLVGCLSYAFLLYHRQSPCLIVLRSSV
jgi:hypothetical protein